MIRTLVLLFSALPLLAACVTDGAIARLNRIRDQKMPELEKELAAADLRPGAPVYLRLFKEERTLEVWVRNDPTGLYQPFKTYQICKDSGMLGPKLEQGDLRSPEGFYDITDERMNPASKYHLAMNIGYPNNYDKVHGRTGNALMIHGGCLSEGCFAMTDPGIEDIYLLAEAAHRAGSGPIPVHIFPFRMTDANMTAHAASEWMPFWGNLKQGYDLFEQTKFPPRVVGESGTYLFAPQAFVYAKAF